MRTHLTRLALVTTIGTAAVAAGAHVSAAQAVTQNGTIRQPTPEASRMPMDQRAALTALVRARTRLATLSERSMSQDGRSALAPLAEHFQQLYRTYTGRDVPKTGGSPDSVPAAPDRVGDPDALKRAYTSLEATVARFIGPARTDGAGAVGTSGGTIKGVPDSALEDVAQFRRDVQLFYRLATGDALPSISDTGNAPR